MRYPDVKVHPGAMQAEPADIKSPPALENPSCFILFNLLYIFVCV
jgi:hypothetical protein